MNDPPLHSILAFLPREAHVWLPGLDYITSRLSYGMDGEVGFSRVMPASAATTVLEMIADSFELAGAPRPRSLPLGMCWPDSP